MAQGRKYYSESVKFNIIELLISKDTNFTLVSKMTGISRQTLYNWYAAHVKEICNENITHKADQSVSLGNVTRQQYLEALEIIDKYHQQSIDSRPINKQPTKSRTTINEWVSSLRLSDKLPARTKQALSYLTDHCKYEGVQRIKYMDEINKDLFTRTRNVGEAAWKEFCNLPKVQELVPTAYLP